MRHPRGVTEEILAVGLGTGERPDVLVGGPPRTAFSKSETTDQLREVINRTSGPTGLLKSADPQAGELYERLRVEGSTTLRRVSWTSPRMSYPSGSRRRRE